MNGIEKIIAHIKSESDAECEDIRRAAAEECEQIRSKYAKAEQDEYEKLLATGKLDADNRLERMHSLAMLESKKHVLMTQQEMVADAFEYAAKKILGLPEPEYVALLAKLAAAASMTGGETLVLSPADKGRIGAAVLEGANGALRAAGKNAGLTLAEKTADIRGGLILSGGDIEVNCSIDALLEECRNELSPAIAAILFD
ncbi:MAG: V-type proton ATPase subunit E [Oscillospiraceae bacterium]|nr:V-type proton ATPase subunit E [Oscillospiraceae bacterium]